MKTNIRFGRQTRERFMRWLAACTITLLTHPASAFAAQSWNPTLLVNTEAFATIEVGDDASTTNIELRFGGTTMTEKLFYNRTNARFDFTRGIQVGGNITGTGTLRILRTMSGGALNVDRNATVGGTFVSSGAITGVGTITAKSTLSGNLLHVSVGGAEIHGVLSSSGSYRSDADITLNDDAGATDAVLTFGNATANQTLKYLNTAQKFQFSKAVSVLGTLSGSSLNVDRAATVGGTLTVSGAVLGISTITSRSTLSGQTLHVSMGGATVRGTLVASGAIRTDGNLSGASLNVDSTINWRGIQYTAPTSQSANTFLKTDGAGALTWATGTAGNGSGDILSLHPEYPNATYFSSGSTTVGQLTYSYDTSNKQNFYRWTSTKTTIQDYWIAVRVQVPANFSSWDVVKPIEFRYRTGSGQVQGSYLNVRMLDTAGTAVALTGGSTLANTSWTTANITGPESAGTWTAKSYFTVLIKAAAETTTSSWNADAGFLNFNWETTTP